MDFQVFSPNEFEKWLDKQIVKRKITRIQLHHTYKPSYQDFKRKPDELYWIKAMDKYATLEKKWQCIAQHFTTFPNGKIGTGRSLEIDPAGIYGINGSSICIENLGNFDSETMTTEQKESIIFLVKVLCKKFNVPINTDRIVAHAWYNRSTGVRNNESAKISNADYKTCPGIRFFGGNSVSSFNANVIPLLKGDDNVIVDKSYIAKKIITADVLNIRPTPDTSKSPVGSFKMGDVVIISGEIGNWLRVSFEGKDAYIHGGYTKPFEEPDYKAKYEDSVKKIEEVKKIVN